MFKKCSVTGGGGLREVVAVRELTVLLTRILSTPQSVTFLQKWDKSIKQWSSFSNSSLWKIGAAFLSTREVSAQECVHRCMPELWLRKIFPETPFVNTDFPQNRLHIPKSQDDLEELEEDSMSMMVVDNSPEIFYSVSRVLLLEYRGP